MWQPDGHPNQLASLKLEVQSLVQERNLDFDKTRANYHNSQIWMKGIWGKIPLQSAPFGVTTWQFGRYRWPKWIYWIQKFYTNRKTHVEGLGLPSKSSSRKKQQIHAEDLILETLG